MGFSLLATPPNYAWQQWLEACFPSTLKEPPAREEEEENRTKQTRDTKTTKENVNKTVRRKTHEGEEVASRIFTTRLSLTNTALKFILDQTLGMAWNTLLFIAGMGMLKGQRWDEIKADLHSVNIISSSSSPPFFLFRLLYPFISFSIVSSPCSLESWRIVLQYE